MIVSPPSPRATKSACSSASSAMNVTCEPPMITGMRAPAQVVGDLVGGRRGRRRAGEADELGGVHVVPVDGRQLRVVDAHVVAVLLEGGADDRQPEAHEVRVRPQVHAGGVGLDETDLHERPLDVAAARRAARPAGDAMTSEEYGLSTNTGQTRSRRRRRAAAGPGRSQPHRLIPWSATRRRRRGSMRVDFDTPVDRSGHGQLQVGQVPRGRPAALGGRHGLRLAAGRRRGAARARRARRLRLRAACPTRWSRPSARICATRYGWRIEPEWLVWLPSVVPGLNLACRAFAGPGEAVMTVTPVYPPFLEAPPDQGRRLVDRAGGASPAAAGSCRWRRWRRPSRPTPACSSSATRTTRWAGCGAATRSRRSWTSAAATTSCCAPTRSTATSSSTTLAHVPAALAAPDDADRIVTLMSPSKTFNLPGLNFAFAIVARRGAAAALPAAGRGAPALPRLLRHRRRRGRLPRGRPAGSTSCSTTCAATATWSSASSPSRCRGVTMTHVEATYLAWLDVRGLGHADAAEACLRGRAWRCRPGPPSATRASCASTSPARGAPCRRRCAACRPPSAELHSRAMAYRTRPPDAPRPHPRVPPATAVRARRRRRAGRGARRRGRRR